jgi:hypothetical protein
MRSQLRIIPIRRKRAIAFASGALLRSSTARRAAYAADDTAMPFVYEYGYDSRVREYKRVKQHAKTA